MALNQAAVPVGLNASLSTGATYLIHRPSAHPRPAIILNIRAARLGGKEAYISFIGQDKRLDTWVSEKEIGEQVVDEPVAVPSSLPLKSPGGSKRRKLAKPLSTPTRQSFSSSPAPEGAKAAAPSADTEHATLTRVRNFEDVRFGEYLIRTWYYSPYPLPPEETTHAPAQPTHNHNRNTNGSYSRKPKSASAANEPPTVSAPAQALMPNTADGKSRSLAASRSIGELLGGGAGKNIEGARGRLWACDLCFKYMRTRVAWERHSSSCQQFLPPGRRVYQRGSYTIWEIDGAQATLYCQNLSLFGKLFIDHKSVFFHVENFLFYIMCDASTSYRDQPMAFFSKEKLSFDDYNLACIVTFPPFQGNGFGKLLIEFSYYLTKHPSSRPVNLSPGTPERPLSDLGLKGYLAYWANTILRYLRDRLADAPAIGSSTASKPILNGAAGAKKDGARVLRRRLSGPSDGKIVEVEGHHMIKQDLIRHRGQYSLITSLAALASACHLRTDDTSFTLNELGLLRYRRPTTTIALPHRRKTTIAGEEAEDSRNVMSEGVDNEGDQAQDEDSLGEWKDVEIVISREDVERLCGIWAVREKPMLDPDFVLLD